MTSPGRSGEGRKHCFTYCGDDRCDCPAREAYGLLEWVGGSLPVLETMCRTIGLNAGADKAAEMRTSIVKATGKATP